VGSPPTAVLADQALIRRVNAGDLSALETLYRTYESVIFNLARRLCGSNAEADDVLQDTFVEVGRSLGRFRGEEGMGAAEACFLSSRSLCGGVSHRQAMDVARQLRHEA
jgi:hypothetical protein